MQWVHVLGIIEFSAPHGSKFKKPCFGFVDDDYPPTDDATPTGPFGSALTYKVIKLYEDDDRFDPYDTHFLLRFNAEIGCYHCYNDVDYDLMSKVEEVEEWLRTTLGKVQGIMGSMQIHLNAFGSNRITLTYAFDRDTNTMQRVHEVTQPKTEQEDICTDG